MLGLLALHAALFVLPAVAASGLAARAGMRAPLALLITGIAGSSLLGFLAFWVYLLSPGLGTAFSLATLTGSSLAAAGPARRAWRMLARPVGLAAAFAAYVLALGYLYGGTAQPLDVAAVRFSHPLPGDNYIPLLFARALLGSHRPITAPLLDTWLSSDRPPLQAGIVVLQAPLTRWDQNLEYQVLAVFLQALAAVGAWAFLQEAGLPRSASAAALLVVVLSGFVLVNTFYVWPKLLASAYLLLIAAMLLTRRYSQVRGSPAWGMACGLLAGLALLSHEGSSIGLLGLAAAMLLRRRVPTAGFLAAGALGLAICLLPWLAYQHFYNPPGDRLTKWFIAGQPALTPTGLWTTLVADYRQAGPGGALADHVQNLWQMWGTPDHALHSFARALRALGGSGGLPRARALSAPARLDLFVQLLPTLGLMALGPVALGAAWLRGRSLQEPAFATAWACWLFATSCALVWAMLFFGPATTAPHQGPYLLELLAMMGSVAAFFALGRVVGVAVCALQVLAAVTLYDLLTPVPGAAPGLASAAAPAPLLAAVLAAGAVGFLACTGWQSPGAESHR